MEAIYAAKEYREYGLGKPETSKQGNTGLKGKGNDGRNSRPKNERYSKKDAKTINLHILLLRYWL